MARIKITLPAKHIFETELVLRISDINYGGHLANDAVLSIAHEARIRFLRKSGYTEQDIEGLGIIMTDAAIVYKTQGYYGDRLTVKISVDDFTRLGFDIYYQIINQDEKEIARVKTNLTFFDYKANKIATVPQGFIEKINAI